MFDSIRDKFQSLQENLTTTLRGLSINDQPTRRQVNYPTTSVNLNAGVDILDKFQTAWAELHEASQENATKADEIDELVCKLHKSVKKQWRDVSQFTNGLISLPEVIYTVNNLCDKIVVLEGLFDSVENALIQLEDIIDTKEFQNKQVEQRFQLALYKEKKLAVLESVRLTLAEEFAEKVRRHEVRQQRLLKECQEASEENFKQDLKVYKETKTIPKIEFAKSKNLGNKESESNTLEDIILDTDDPSALDEFLNDSTDSNKEITEENT